MEYLWSSWPLLLCPLVMGPMMWLMMRMNRPQEMTLEAASSDPGMLPAGVGAAVPEAQLAMLRAALDDISTQQAAITGQIARLSDGRPPAAPVDPRPTDSTRSPEDWRPER